MKRKNFLHERFVPYGTHNFSMWNEKYTRELCVHSLVPNRRGVGIAGVGGKFPKT